VTAYRTADAPPDAPYVNPHLEQALLDHYRKQRRLDFIPLVVLVSASVMLVVFALEYDVAREAARLPLLGLFAGPCAFGAAIMGFGLVRKRPQPLLDRIQTGIPIRRVHRDDSPALYVVFADGSSETLGSFGNQRRLARIEHLLMVQMETGSAPPRHARVS
jgi:hypothetical protein